MNDIAKAHIAACNEKMNNSLNFLVNELSKIRAGKANVHILSGVVIDYFGVKTPLNQMANINTPDAKTIIIQPWDKTSIALIEKEIMKANLGITPQNDGQVIRLMVPPLTEERRKQLVKQLAGECEKAKVNIRNIRRDIIEDMKKFKNKGVSEDDIKETEANVQKLTDTFIKKIGEVQTQKEKEIMTV